MKALVKKHSEIPEQVIPFTDRCDYLSSMLFYSMAVEKIRFRMEQKSYVQRMQATYFLLVFLALI